MDSAINWTATEADHPARNAARASMDAVTRRAKEDWLALFAADAIVEDPIGPSPWDPNGVGYHGKSSIGEFWDATIGEAAALTFHIHDSFAAGNEVANTGTITTTLPDGSSMDAEGVFVYRVNDEGKVRSLRAFWEFDRAMNTLRSAS